MATPIRKRKSMFEKDVGISPLRKSVITSTPFLNHVINDDEIERSRRRSVLESVRRISNVNHLNHSIAQETVELSENHYNTCLKLFMENKISPNNVWQLHIIEYMRNELVKDGRETQDHLQMASASLDIAAKVYGIRVDDMHQGSLRLATVLMAVNTDQNRDDTADHNADDNDEEVRQSTIKKKVVRKKKRLSTDDMTGIIAAKDDQLNAKLTTHNTSYKQQGKKLNVLMYQGSLLSKEALLVPCRGTVPFWTPVEPENADVTFSKLVPAKIETTPGLICPSFHDFVADHWDPNDDSLYNSRTSDKLVYDDNGFPLPELDASLNNFDNFYNNGGGDCSDIEEEMVGGGHAALHTEVAHVTEMRPKHMQTDEDGARLLEYSYISAPIIGERYTITGVWAGPAHWKLKSLLPRTSTVTTINAQKQKRAPRLEILQMDFLDIDEEEFDALMSVSRRPGKRRRYRIEDFTLPEDLCVDRNECHTLMSMPTVRVPVAGVRTSETCHEDLNITNYNYDNANDADYCSQTLTDDINQDDFDGNQDQPGADPDAEQPDQTIVDLISAPNYVSKTMVPYAMHAKKMDMKKLKDAIWRELEQNDPNNTVIDNAVPEVTHFSLVSFEDLYDCLPNRLSSKLSSELSLPLAFVALLHLTNEKTLKLMGQPNLLNLVVSMDT